MAKIGRRLDNFAVVSGYTINTPYEQEVEILKKSLNKFNLSTEHIVAYENQGSWEKNCQEKAKIIYKKLKELKIPIVWLDADAELFLYPALFHNIKKDIAFCYYKKEVLSGTLYLKPTKKIFFLLEEWIEENKKNANWDQKNLEKIIFKNNIDFEELPTSYCKIDFFPADEIIIGQNQASRRFKEAINNENFNKTDPYSTHLQGLVYAALKTTGDILELGCGNYSTPVLHSICSVQNRKLTIISSEPQWANSFRKWAEIELIQNWNHYEFNKKYGMVLLDNEQLTKDRVHLIPKLLKITDAIVIHDAELLASMPNWQEYTKNCEIVWFKYYKPNTAILFKKQSSCSVR